MFTPSYIKHGRLLIRHAEKLLRYRKDVLGDSTIARADDPGSITLNLGNRGADNLMSFLALVVRDGELSLDFDDEIVRDTCVTHEGRVLKEPA